MLLKIIAANGLDVLIFDLKKLREREILDEISCL
jgi:hypothetical protein